MLSPSQFSPQAWDDMRAIVAYIAADNPDAAGRFVPALETTYAQLVALPGMGSVRHFRRKDLKGVRIMSVTGFESYLLFYATAGTSIKVLRILHAARDFPRYLRDFFFSPLLPLGCETPATTLKFSYPVLSDPGDLPDSRVACREPA